MSFTMYLMILYLGLLIIDIFAFLKGKENKKWMPFIIITAIMVIGITALGYLWITSPM